MVYPPPTNKLVRRRREWVILIVNHDWTIRFESTSVGKWSPSWLPSQPVGILDYHDYTPVILHSNGTSPCLVEKPWKTIKNWWIFFSQLCYHMICYHLHWLAIIEHQLLLTMNPPLLPIITNHQDIVNDLPDPTVARVHGAVAARDARLRHGGRRGMDALGGTTRCERVSCGTNVPWTLNHGRWWVVVNYGEEYLIN